MSGSPRWCHILPEPCQIRSGRLAGESVRAGHTHLKLQTKWMNTSLFAEKHTLKDLSSGWDLNGFQEYYCDQASPFRVPGSNMAQAELLKRCPGKRLPCVHSCKPIWGCTEDQSQGRLWIWVCYCINPLIHFQGVLHCHHTALYRTTCPQSLLQQISKQTLARPLPP